MDTLRELYDDRNRCQHELGKQHKIQSEIHRHEDDRVSATRRDRSQQCWHCSDSARPPGKVALYPNLQFYIDGSHPTTAFIPEQTTTQFSILDFTWVTPVSTWTTNSNVLGQFTSWTLDPASSQYNLTLGVPSPEDHFSKHS